MPKWIRYRFKTKAIKDYRPIIFNEKYPWWCSGESDDDVTIVAYLPKAADLNDYWDDATEIETTAHESIEFTERFSEPDYFIKS
jgi:hypothetical protein